MPQRRVDPVLPRKTPQPRLEHIDENWTTALAVVAHPDDLEFGAAAAIARWTAQGKQITYCMATSGEAGIDGVAPEQTLLLREREQRGAAAVVGVDEVCFLRHGDGVVEYGLALRRDIARVIRQARPTIVVTTNYSTTNGRGMVNQADHVSTGRAVIDAIRDAGNRWVFRELLDEGLQPWTGVRAAFVAGSPDSAHGADVTDTFAQGIASLQAHRAYMAGLGAMGSRVETLLDAEAREVGKRLGATYATCFE